MVPIIVAYVDGRPIARSSSSLISVASVKRAGGLVACSSGSLLPSPVLRAMGVPNEVLHSAMRFSLSALLSEAEIDEAARRIVEAVRRLRTLRSDPAALLS